ncbi:MAG: acetamidase/formamidase family protein [Armatimonadota bacterium]
MKRLTRDHKVFTLSKDHPPVMEIEPGETVLVETTDSFDAQFDKSTLTKWDAGTSTEDTSIDLSRALPHTGPIAVRGAEPGDTLVAELLQTIPVSNGYISCLPGFSRLLLGHKIPQDERWTVRIVETLPGVVKFDEGIYYPYRLMVGSLGVAPNGEVPTATPGDYGGNHDCYLYTVGSKLYLPVKVPGALVALGDVHAAMGDGEGAGTANEIDAEVTVKFDLIKRTGHLADFPVLETGTHWMPYGSAAETDDALAAAKDNAISLLNRKLGLDYADCYMLMAAACHIRINELVNPTRSARVEIPKYLLTTIF